MASSQEEIIPGSFVSAMVDACRGFCFFGVAGLDEAFDVIGVNGPLELGPFAVTLLGLPLLVEVTCGDGLLFSLTGFDCHLVTVGIFFTIYRLA